MASTSRQYFDRKMKLRQREAAAAHPRARAVEALRDAVASQLVDRLLDIRRDFPVAVDLGSGTGAVPRALAQLYGRAGVRRLLLLDGARAALFRDWPGTPGAQPAAVGSAVANDEGAELWPVDDILARTATDPIGAGPDQPRDTTQLLDGAPTDGTTLVERLCIDEEGELPIPDGSVGVVMSCLSLHWVNDLEGTLRRIRRALRPDGVFIGAVFGGDCIPELRTSLVAAEMERSGGVSPRVSPMMDVADASALLSAAGFSIPTVDTSFLQVPTDHAFETMEVLQAMGESGACVGRPGGMGSADVLLAAAAIEHTLYGGRGLADVDGTADPRVAAPGLQETLDAAGEDAAAEAEDAHEDAPLADSVPMSLQVVFMIGWSPHSSQQEPLEPGSRPKGFSQRK